MHLKRGTVVGLANHTALIARDGTERQIADSAAPIRDAEDSITGVVLVFRDVTEDYAAQAALEASELSFRNLFENAGISIWSEDLSAVYDTLGQLRHEGVTDLRQYLKEQPQVAWDVAAQIRVVDINQATLKLFGAATDDEFLERIDKSFGAGTVDVFVDELCAIWEGRSEFRAEAEYRAVDGRRISAIVSFRIPAAGEDLRNVPASIVDITERKQAEAEQARLQRELHPAHKMEALGQITGGIAHDFNNILGVMLGYTELALNRSLRGGDWGEQVKYLKHVEKAGLRAKNLVAQMLAYSRRETLTTVRSFSCRSSRKTSR